MNRAGQRGDEPRDVRNGDPNWQAYAATAVVAVACMFVKLLRIVMGFKDAEETVRWAANIFTRTLTDESPSGGCSVPFYPFKWLFILPLMLMCLAVGCYIGHTFGPAMENAEETLERLFRFRWLAAWVAVNQVFNVEDLVLEAAEVEG